MSVVKLVETPFPQAIVDNLAKDAFDITDKEAVMFLECLIEGTSDFLREVKTKSVTGKDAVSFKDLKGNFIAAAVVEYTENEEEDGQDNFNYYWTFNEDDINGPDTKIYDAAAAPTLVKVVNRVKENSYVMANEWISYLESKIMVGLSDLVNALSGQVTDTESVSIEHDGFFKITIAMEDGKMYKSFIPDGPIKTLVKNDAATM